MIRETAGLKTTAVEIKLSHQTRTFAVYNPIDCHISGLNRAKSQASFIRSIAICSITKHTIKHVGYWICVREER
jgi:hypothetical protein